MIKANELRKGVLIIDYTGIVREVYGEDIQQQCWYEEGQTGTTEAPLNPHPTHSRMAGAVRVRGGNHSADYSSFDVVYCYIKWVFAKIKQKRLLLCSGL